jgi:hypothetical protein
MASYSKPKFYPILPYSPREKRGKRGISKGNVKCQYRRYQWYDLFQKVPRVLTEFVPADYTVTVGVNSQGGVNQPGWRTLIAKGGDATTNYGRTMYSMKPISYVCNSENKDNLSKGFGTVDGGLYPAEGEYFTLEDQALAALKRRLNGNIGKAQLAAPLAESKEIHRLVRQINTLALDMLKAALAIKKTGGKSAAKAFANVWLGFGFGVKPMIDDIANAANAILDYTTREDRRVRVVGTASRVTYTSGKYAGPETGCYGLSWGFYHHTEHKQGVQIMAGIDLQMRTAASYSVADHLGLTWNAVPGAAWELLPFSWVVDYALTVGPWLDDMFYTLPGSAKYVSKGKKYQCETMSYPYYTLTAGYTGSFGGGAGKGKFASFTREKLSSLPTRALRVKSMDEIAQHGLTKVLNLASVLAQKRGPNL